MSNWLLLILVGAFAALSVGYAWNERKRSQPEIAGSVDAPPIYAPAQPIMQKQALDPNNEAAGSIYSWQDNYAKTSAAQQLTASDGAGWKRIWQEAGQIAPPMAWPNGYAAVAVFLGNRPSAGFGVELALRQQAGQLQVGVVEKTPVVGEKVMPGSTSPYAIKLFPATGIQAINFVAMGKQKIDAVQQPQAPQTMMPEAVARHAPAGSAVANPAPVSMPANRSNSGAAPSSLPRQ